MARKNLLSGLMAAPPDGSLQDPPAPPRRTTGALGAVGKSFAEMRANSVIDIPADMIDMAGIEDRLGEDPDQAALMESLKTYGQQVPVLVRHSPNTEGRYEIVYGRRRAAALRKLGLKVRAMVRDLPDRDLIVAQGQENTARRDLSFIEKVNFARQMAEMHFDRKVICDALHVDKTQLSKMMKVADGVPERVIRAIGPAPNTGRDRWVSLAAVLDGRAEPVLEAVVNLSDSDARFEAALAALAPEQDRKPPAPKGQSAERAWGKISQGVRGTTISVPRKNQEFADWLLSQIDDLHAQWAEAKTDSETGKD